MNEAGSYLKVPYCFFAYFSVTIKFTRNSAQYKT